MAYFPLTESARIFEQGVHHLTMSSTTPFTPRMHNRLENLCHIFKSIMNWFHWWNLVGVIFFHPWHLRFYFHSGTESYLWVAFLLNPNVYLSLRLRGGSAGWQLIQMEGYITSHAVSLLRFVPLIVCVRWCRVITAYGTIQLSKHLQWNLSKSKLILSYIAKIEAQWKLLKSRWLCRILEEGRTLPR